MNKHIFSIFFTILLVLLIIIFNSYSKQLDIEAFSNNYTNSVWSKDLIDRFLNYQATVNENNNQFDINILQQQATPSETEEYLKTGYWKWSKELMKEYLIEVGNNPIIKLDPGVSLNYAMRLYNQNAIKEILAWNTKEGQFLLNGIDLGVSSTNNQKYNSVSNPHNTIKCSTDKNGNSVLEKTVFNGINSWNGYPNEIKTNLSNEELPNEIPGFSFIKNPCNPCVALNNPADYSCPFNIKVKGEQTEVSSIWSKLWNL